MEVVGVLFAQEVLKKGVNMHGAHPALQSHRILLDLLRALALVRVRRRNAQIERQLRPGLDLLRIELAYQLEERPAAESVAIAFGGRAKELHQLGGVGRDGKIRVAVQDEGRVCVTDGFVGHVTRRRIAVVGHITCCQLLGLARGGYGGKTRGGARGRSVRGARHVAIEAVCEMGAAERGIVGLEEVVCGRLMRERRHGRVAIPSSRCRLVQAGINGYASRGVPVFVVGVVRVRVVNIVLRLCVLVKVDLHDSGRFGGSALIAGPSARHGCPEVSRECANLNNRPLL